MTYSLDALPTAALDRLKEHEEEGEVVGLRSYDASDRRLIRSAREEIFQLQDQGVWHPTIRSEYIHIALIDYYERERFGLDNNLPEDRNTSRVAGFHYGLLRDDGQRESLIVFSREAAEHFEDLYDEVIRHELAHAYAWIRRGRGHRDGEQWFEAVLDRFDGGTSDRMLSEKLGKRPYYKVAAERTEGDVKDVGTIKTAVEAGLRNWMKLRGDR